MTRGMVVGILKVTEGSDAVCFAVVLEQEVIFDSIDDFASAVALLMGLLYGLDIDYPKGLRHTFEVTRR